MALASTETVRVDVVAGGVMVVGANDRVMPGCAVALKSTGLLNPFRELMVIIDV